MTDANKAYTAHDVASAAIDLRNAAGVAEEQFPLGQVIGMLGDEIRLLRERGFTDDRVATMLQDAGIRATAADLQKHTFEDVPDHS